MWFQALKNETKFRGNWGLIDPDAENTPDIVNSNPKVPTTLEKRLADEQRSREEAYTHRL